MSVLACLDEFVRQMRAFGTIDELASALDHVTNLLGFDHYEVAEHANLRARPSPIRLHSYPENLARRFKAEQLGGIHPIHRASRQTSVGFTWEEVRQLIELTQRERRFLAAAADHGIVSGFTVPANVPGEICGSCSFTGQSPISTPGVRPVAQLAGAFAFEAARRLWHGAPLVVGDARLTDRERDCVIWVGRDKSDWEIATILGISAETVVCHVKNARRRYRVHKRTSLIVRTLFDGTITFRDLLKW
ncbi:LuxR family transcriptional regulator [Sphingomonas sp. BIUV-7]|uniref:LuxR family transcriptional regulator n=1 Tax=Sphingomonas natans TaxID=3063330 RepID=A0ABT8YED4_9SPHN|nr:LuxR family transcriptional regulator [Sphingomonas sp. BIUV-7]MDO6416143.1 LuxR family transcriptional regulator [Sphingomonas sp. BIUV-7]